MPVSGIGSSGSVPGWPAVDASPIQTDTDPNTPARSGRPQRKTWTQEHKTTPHSAPRSDGVQAGAHTNTYIPKHPSQEWRGAAEA